MRVAIVAQGDSWRGVRGAKVDEVWAINAIGLRIRHDLLFHMDDCRVQEVRAVHNPSVATLLELLRASPAFFTSTVYPEYPGAIAYPLETVVNDLRTTYLNGTTAYAVAYAIHQEVEEILRYNERVRLAGADADDAALVRGFERVEAARAGTELTYFEFGTLAAFVTFLESGVEALVLEVGLGGRLDAVNIVDADCAIVTTVDLDHQAWLGDTREAIAFEKAHIYRPGRPAFFGDRQPPESLAAHARSIGAALQVLGRDYRARASGNQWDFEGAAGAKRALPMPALRGSWQLGNAATALAALDALAGRLPVSAGEIRRGLTSVRLAGRLQVLPGRPQVVLDVAHNPHAARALATGLGDMGFAARTIAVFAVLSDKDIDGVVAAMAERVDAWLIASVHNERAASVEAMMASLARHGLEDRARAFASVALAYEAARQMAAPDDRILVFGSFHTVAAVLELPR